MAAVSGDVATAMRLQFELMPLHKNLFVEANPIPVKWAAARMGLCGGAMRLPMTTLSASAQPVVEQAMRATGLLKD
jgi:4-hydroxy-tetrahydrodipicolinate synthase